MKKYSIGQFAKEIGVTVQTLRNCDCGLYILILMLLQGR